MSAVSFRTYIASIFIVIFSLLSFTLIYSSVRYSQTVELTLSQDIISEYSNELEAKIQLVSKPLTTLLDSLAMTQFMKSDIDIYDQRWLSSLSKILKYNPYVSTLYFANRRGNSFSVQPVYSEQTRLRLSAPESTVIVIKYNNINGQQRRIFFNANMKMISSTRYNINNYDPRIRPWFKGAKDDGRIFVTDPYAFYTSKKIGITFSRRSLDGESVVAADFSLDSLTHAMQLFQYSENSKVFLLTADQQVISSNQTFEGAKNEKPVITGEFSLEAILPNFAFVDLRHPVSETINWQSESWELLITPVVISEDNALYLVNLVPYRDVLASSIQFRNQLMMVSICSVIVGFIIIIFVTRRIANPLIYLNQSLENIQRFSYQRKVYKPSHIVEIDKLHETIQLMESVLLDFFDNLHNVARSSKPEELSESIVTQVQSILSADNCQLFINSRDNREQFHITANSGAVSAFNLQPLFDLNATAFNKRIYELNSQDALVAFDATSCNAGFIIPLINRNSEHIGVLVIGFNDRISIDAYNRIHFVREFIAFNEIVLEHLEKEQEQQELFHSFVEMTATAVDIKSSFTGGHCQRVPKITKLIAAAADRDNSQFKDFKLTPKSWEELLVAAWLHDCGKVTTPDYVLDKATKLETVYDRIHEVRMRYEVLKRDADINRLLAVIEGQGEKQAQLDCDKLKAELDKEFAFIAQCNPGCDYLDPEKQLKLTQFAKRTWLRTLPNNIGISQEELNKQSLNTQVLPVTERVLDDKPEHLIAWNQQAILPANSKRDFKLLRPEYRFNRGELYNLMVKNGTLTAEDRYSINDHIVQTYLMLDQLPYPEHLKNVPLIAGSHHEKMNGNGYPLQLKGEEIPIGSRMIAVADVFEALTACDRPYKAAKTLSHSLKIMAFMVKDEHLDGNVFDLFLTRGIYQEYADQYLTAEQLDDVDVEALRRIYKGETQSVILKHNLTECAIV